MSKEERKKYIMAVLEKAQAIDFTPIYFLTALKDIKQGTIIRFDTAEDLLKEADE